MTFRWPLPCVLAGLLVAGGCRNPSPDVVFHTLRPLAQEEVRPADSGPPLALEIMPVRLPELLQRSQIVVLKQPGSHRILPTHRWGNTLEKDMQRVLAENLATLLGTDEVLPYPQGNPNRAVYQIALDVQQCEGEPGGTLRFRAVWMVVRVADGRRVHLRRSAFQEPVQGLGIEGLVAAHDRVLDQLSREIAAAVRKGFMEGS